MLTIIVAAVPGMLRPAVLPAIAASGHHAEPRWLRDDLAYGRLLAELWASPHDICLVEHDIEINPGTLDSFERCPEPWCTAPYRVAGSLVDGIGCSRWRHPRPFGPLEPVHWANVESGYVTQLRRLGVTAHRHPEVTHHHAY